jgi:signal transduction histidine kinase/ligand-binding sensor domain-containing protein
VSTVIETPTGEYFVGTARGVSRINASGPGSRFTTYAPEREAALNSVATLRESRTGKIWYATARSLFEWNGANDFRRTQLVRPPNGRITSIAEDPHGDLWIGTIEGMYLLGDSGIAQSLTVRDGLPGNWVEALLLDSQGRLWAAVRGGLVLITRKATGHWGVDKVYTDRSGLAGSDVKAIAEASDGTLWVGTMMGISRLGLRSAEPAVLQNLTRAQGLSDRAIVALAEDQAGNIWAGTAGAGVMRIDRLGFTTYREQDGFPTDRLFSVFEDRDGELLAVTLGAGGGSERAINIFDGAKFHSVAPKTFGERAGWGWNRTVLQSRTGEWWAATKNGLCRYLAVKARALNGLNPQACYAPEDDVFQVFEDSKGRIWASAQSEQGDQLLRWDPGARGVYRYPSPRIPGGPTNDLVTAFAEDPQGNIWMGLHRGGVYRYDGRAFQYFQKEDGVPGGTILMLLSSQSGLWIASNGGGLGRMTNADAGRPRMEVFDSAHGLASDFATCIAEDPQGRIYAGTTKGVDRLDPKTGYIRHFASGLAHGDCNSAFRDRSGALWFATTQGLSKLVPSEDRPPANPRVFITELRVGSTPYPLSQRGEARVSKLESQPSHNQLQIEFVGLDHEPGQVLRYSYKLDGADSAWSPPSAQRAVNYAALSGGTYRFRVKAVTSEGVESASPAGVDFTVLLPFWRRWWFESLAAAMAAALVLAAHRYRVTQMVNLERMRTAIATDLHDDIGSSLSQIAVLSEVARASVNGGNPRTQESLQRVAVLARELVDSLGDIVWSIRSVPDGLDSLVTRMREFALDLLAGQGIDFELRSPRPGQGEARLNLEARRHLFLIFKECIHNAARHSGCTAVAAELRIEEREIVLTMTDNGKGLPSGDERHVSGGGNGIPGMRQRAGMLGGHIDFLSKPGEGCTVSVTLPLSRARFLTYRA